MASSITQAREGKREREREGGRRRETEGGREGGRKEGRKEEGKGGGREEGRGKGEGGREERKEASSVLSLVCGQEVTKFILWKYKSVIEMQLRYGIHDVYGIKILKST